jgi:hypothetical protein
MALAVIPGIASGKVTVSAVRRAEATTSEARNPAR